MSRGGWALPHVPPDDKGSTRGWGGVWQDGEAAEGAITRVCREYTIDLEQGSQHLIRYRTIAPLVASGAVQLI